MNILIVVIPFKDMDVKSRAYNLILSHQIHVCRDFDSLQGKLDFTLEELKKYQPL